MSQDDLEVKTLLEDFHNYQLPIFVINEGTTLEKTIDIFDRLNRGQAHNEIEKLHGLYCNTALYESISKVMKNGMRSFVKKYLALDYTRMEDLRFCINLYLSVLLKQNVDGSDKKIRQKFGECCKNNSIDADMLLKTEQDIEKILKTWGQMNIQKTDALCNQTNIYTILTFIFYCHYNNFIVSDNIIEKIKEFFNKVKQQDNSPYINEYIKATKNSSNKKSSRNRRLKALLVYTKLKSPETYGNTNDFGIR